MMNGHPFPEGVGAGYIVEAVFFPEFSGFGVINQAFEPLFLGFFGVQHIVLDPVLHAQAEVLFDCFVDKPFHIKP